MTDVTPPQAALREKPFRPTLPSVPTFMGGGFAALAQGRGDYIIEVAKINDYMTILATEEAVYVSREQAAAFFGFACAAEKDAENIELRALVNVAEIQIDNAKAERDTLQARVRVLEATTAAQRDVLAERRRQVEVEGWTAEHDDEHDDQQLALAALCYVLCYCRPQPEWVTPHDRTPPDRWPWQRGWWRPKSPRRDLIKAGALILAEIERLDRAALTAAAPQGESK